MSFHVVIGSGPTGAATALLLAQFGEQVRMVTRRGTGPAHPRIELTAADVSSGGLVNLAIGADTLFNCAMPTYSRWPEEAPALSDALIDAAERTGAGYVSLSNPYGYGPVDGPWTDDLPMRPTTVKGRVRAKMYLDGLAAHDAGRLRFAEVRAADYLGVNALATFNIFIGPRVRAGQDVVIPADPDVPHSWTYTGDVAKTLVAVARSERSWGSAWHAPQASVLTVREIAARYAALIGRPRPDVRSMSPLEFHTAMSDPVMVELAEMAYLFYRPNVMDWSRTATEFDLTAASLDDVLRETAHAAGNDAPDSSNPVDHS